ILGAGHFLSIPPYFRRDDVVTLIGQGILIVSSVHALFFCRIKQPLWNPIAEDGVKAVSGRPVCRSTLPYDVVRFYQKCRIPRSSYLRPSFQSLGEHGKILLCKHGLAARGWQIGCVGLGFCCGDAPFFQRRLYATAVFRIAPVSVFSDEESHLGIFLEGL